MLETLFWILIVVIGWSWSGIMTGIIWAIGMEEEKEINVGDFLSSMILGPLLTYSITLLWIGLKVDIQNINKLFRYLYIFFYIPIEFISWIECFVLRGLNFLPSRFINKRLL